MGYIDSVNSLKEDVDNGFVTAKVEDGELVMEGNTFKYKDFLKAKFRGTGIHWDKDREAWVVSIDKLYSGDKMRVDEYFGIEIA